MPLSNNSTRCPGCPFHEIRPAARKSFWHPGGGGVPIFDRDSEGRVPYFYGDSGGGNAFFMGTFPKKYPPPITRNTEQSLSWKKSMRMIINFP